MFVDVAKIYVKGGDGGNGSTAMRREKFVPLGGPWGGDGGRGGDVIFVVDEGLNTLVDFRYNRHYKAERGAHGGGKGMHGRGAPDLLIKVPPGTLVTDADTGETLGDLTENGQQLIVAKGGRGGRGNIRFATPINKAPTFAELGEPGVERNLLLELKVIADVGLVGFPNAGKSTLLSSTTGARPKVANYPFTTLNPHLGVVTLPGHKAFVMADIPGLIEGASAGVGLGHEFLRHVERTRVLVHVIDGAGTDGRDPLEDFRTINRELEAYNPVLASRRQIVAFNKVDVPEAAAYWAEQAKPYFEENGYKAFAISGVSGEGLEPLLWAVDRALEAEAAEPPELTEELAERVYRAEDRQAFTIHRENHIWVVEGQEIERLVAMTPWENEEAVARFTRIFRRMGIEEALRAYGAEDGATVQIRGVEFELTSDISI